MTGFDASREALKTMLNRAERELRDDWISESEPIWNDDADILTEVIGSRKIAEAWIFHSGNLAGVASTNRSELHVIAKKSDFAYANEASSRLQAIHRYGFRALAQRSCKRPLLSNREHINTYLRIRMQAEGVFQLRILFLDAHHQLILDEVFSRGSVSHVPVYPREVMRRALEVHAAFLLLVHNHPWGDPEPLPWELECAKSLISAAEPLGISIHDHLIVGRNGVASLRHSGDLDKCERRAQQLLFKRRVAESRLREQRTDLAAPSVGLAERL